MLIVLHIIEILLLVFVLCRQPNPNGLSPKAERILSRIERKAKALAAIV